MYEQSNQTYEQLYNPEEVLKWLAYVGNDEKKLLTLLTIAGAGEPLGRTGLYKSLSSHAGPEGIPGVESGPIFACHKSIAKTGGINFTQTEIHRPWPQIVPAVEITEVGKAMVPFAGALLKWSLDHPELQLRSIFGDNSQSDLIRYQVLYDLALTPDRTEDPSINSLAPHAKSSKSSRWSAIDRLKQAGILDKESILDDNKSIFTIVQPEYLRKERKRPFEKLLPETQLLFNSFKAAYNIKGEWTIEGFFRLIAELYPNADKQTVYQARQRLTHALVDSSHNLRGVVEYSGGKYLDNTRVTIKPEKLEAITELVDIIDAFCSADKEAIEQGEQSARQIISSTEAVVTLYSKAYARSTKANRDSIFDKRLVEIIRNTGSMATAKTVRDAYIQETGRNISLKTINERLKGLSDYGILSAQPQPRSAFNRQPVKNFTSS